eukprot:evm.model.scf_280EXC.14 EVM.evm.TU.scf_280EXC.14   scf_280EXC:77142-80347(-)
MTSPAPGALGRLGSMAPSALHVRHPEAICGRTHNAAGLGGRRRGCAAGANRIVAVADVSTSDFEDVVLKSDIPVLVDFVAPWCGPCKLVAPIVEWAEKEYAGALKIVKIDIDPNPDLVEQYKVYGLPTLLMFRNGEAIEGSKHEGAITKDKLIAYIRECGVAPVKS